MLKNVFSPLTDALVQCKNLRVGTKRFPVGTSNIVNTWSIDHV